MSARQTSAIAYSQIEKEGLLSSLRWKVYDYLYRFGPCTAKQLTVGLTADGENSGVYTTRLSELKAAGVVRDVGSVKCAFTGRSVLLWDVTPHLPIDVPSKLTAPKKLKVAVDALYIAVSCLRKSGHKDVADEFEQLMEELK